MYKRKGIFAIVAERFAAIHKMFTSFNTYVTDYTYF